jgi:hypothetical protein
MRQRRYCSVRSDLPASKLCRFSIRFQQDGAAALSPCVAVLVLLSFRRYVVPLAADCSAAQHCVQPSSCVPFAQLSLVSHLLLVGFCGVLCTMMHRLWAQAHWGRYCLGFESTAQSASSSCACPPLVSIEVVAVAVAFLLCLQLCCEAWFICSALALASTSYHLRRPLRTAKNQEQLPWRTVLFC